MLKIVDVQYALISLNIWTCLSGCCHTVMKQQRAIKLTVKNIDMQD